MNGLASSLAEIEALRGPTGMTACNIVVCPPSTPIERAVAPRFAVYVRIPGRKEHETL
jgi:hypothetical protein